MNAQEIAMQGFALHQAGRLIEAEMLYRKALQLSPALADALHLLGVCEHQLGRNADAIEHIDAAIRIEPGQSGYCSNLGTVLAAMGRYEEAVATLSAAVQLDPNAADAYINLGNALRELNRDDEAEAAYRRAISIRPDYPEAHYHVAGVLASAGRFDEAEMSYQRAIELRPDYSDAMNSLGALLQGRTRFQEATNWFERAIAGKPDFVQAMNNLGNTLRDLNRLNDAIGWYQRALSIRQDADVLNNLANVFRQQDRLDEAEAAAQLALQLRPRFAEALATLGGVQKDAGRMELAIQFFDQSMALRPSAQLAGNMLFLLHHLDGMTHERLQAAHADWNERYAKPLVPKSNPSIRRSGRNRLRVGYVSPDFSSHPVGRFILPLLENHDHSRFEVFCYTDVSEPDAVTKRIERCADIWRPTLGRGDDDVAEIIRRDEIDVLIDLAMHTRHSRIMLFARKPASVQVSYLAYPSTTGLASMDYRISDPYLDPPGSESGYCEKTVRLPSTYWCYSPPAPAPDIGPLPVDRAGKITFGCLNQYAKVTPRARAAWRDLLRRVPDSRFLLHAPPGRHCDEAKRELQQDGLDPNRLQFVGRILPPEYFATYNEIDIGLDTFPYPGGTTTCDALWMGVPVVSLPGELTISRGGLSILSNVGLEEFAAGSINAYIDIAAALAADLARLRKLRASMRQRMITSRLMDAKQFARDFEAMLESIAART